MIGNCCAQQDQNMVTNHQGGFLLDPLPTEDPEPSSTPVFLEEPQDASVVGKKPATLSCKARHALQVYFECNGRLAENRQHSMQQYVNPMSGVRQVEVSVDVTRGDVEKILAGDIYSCYCFAWSSTGRIKSRKAIVSLSPIDHHSWKISKPQLRPFPNLESSNHCPSFFINIDMSQTTYLKPASSCC
ncbi:netrin receptor UNC5C [Nephila pilipes]|uniref:Netrin receptor UNC5C n=1 Tax=Nephila pilipes TaxID=299642 RepID=A0A8X6MQ56_NEPPI|nr:netrin receptor UNC5C [Nephila pilipes]